ncbi:MAG: aromatic ring hydroxylase [Candidatus Aenigmatarchaeota archaeon]|nr:MAG: aromatic ring hydroxylase [Candidatus Aenigmarchaeota archaeon]
MVTKREVMKVLKECYDPEIPLSIVDLGLIYDVKVEKGRVKIRMTLTAPTCPMGSFIVENVRNKVKEIKGVKSVDIELVFEPAWSPERMSKKARRILGFE